MADDMYNDPNFREFMTRLESLCSEARGRKFIEAYIVLSTLKGAILSGRLKEHAMQCKKFADKLSEELLSKKPKRKINFEREE